MVVSIVMFTAVMLVTLHQVIATILLLSSFFVCKYIY